MAVYKVIQDVEAEDKILGPLSLKGFVYAGITALLAFICIRLAISGAPTPLKLIITLVFLPPMVLFGVLASPLGREQPTEVWLLSRLRFLLKPRLRKWDQYGIKDLVKVTVPKKEEKQLVKDLSQPEVSSRLQALANTLDSRGWAVKNVTVNLTNRPYIDHASVSSDRLADATNLSEAEPVLDVHLSDDILDSENPTAQNFDSLMQEAEEQRKAAAQERLRAARVEAASAPAKTVDNLTPEERQLLEQVHERDRRLAQTQLITKGGAAQPMTSKAQAVKLELAQSGNDFSVATIAGLANKASEVVVPLH